MKKLIDTILMTVAIIMLVWALWTVFTTDCENDGTLTQLPGECK